MNNLYVLFCASSNTLELRQYIESICDGHSFIEQPVFDGELAFNAAVKYSANLKCASLAMATEVVERVQVGSFSQQIDTFIVEKPKNLAAKIEQLFFDMDSTLIDMEVIVALAEFAGSSKEVSDITERAMNGELNFAESLIHRVATLKGIPKSVIEQVKSSLPLNTGAELLAEFMQKNAIKGYILSGGFSYFTNVLVKKLNFVDSKANALVISEEGTLTGELEGEIVDAQTKADYVLVKTSTNSALHMVVGDGANDLKMMETTPYSVAYKAKPIVNKQARFAIKNTGLDAIIYLLKLINSN